MPESPDVISAQLRDLKELMLQRFDDVDKRLDSLESQELHESDIKHVNRRIDDLKADTDAEMTDLKSTVADLKSSVWRAAGAAGTVVGLIVGLLEWAIPLIMH